VFAVPSITAQFYELSSLHPLRSTGVYTDLNHGIAMQSLEFALELVKFGQFCAYLPLPVCQAGIDSGAIRIANGLGPQDPLDLFLINHEKRYQPRRVTLFKDFKVGRLSD
jgi:DNA-binding transcriptional LysR family regulator